MPEVTVRLSAPVPGRISTGAVSVAAKTIEWIATGAPVSTPIKSAEGCTAICTTEEAVGTPADQLAGVDHAESPPASVHWVIWARELAAARTRSARTCGIFMAINRGSRGAVWR